MSEPLSASRLFLVRGGGAQASEAAARKPARALSSALLVLGFWWLATGLTIVLQQTDSGLGTIGLVALVLAASGAALVVRSRATRTASGARLAFFGGALLWWSAISLFYGGWGITATTASPGAPRTMALAIQAIAATWRADAVAVVFLIGVLIGVWRHSNRVAFWSLFTFWGTLQTAKINIFLGVVNAGAELLPPKLATLGTYFGPPHLGVLLPLTVVALLAVTIWLGVRAARSGPDSYERHGATMLAVLVALAVVEHAALAVPAGLPIWSVFLR